MTLCVGTGYISENGPCTFLDMVDTHGVVLTTCADIVYAPAACPDAPDEGVVYYGPGYVKIASVDGTVPDIGVQRDADGIAYATEFVVDVAACDHYGTRVQERYVHVGNANGAEDTGIAFIQAALRLRGHGDVAGWGGTETQATYGIGKIERYGSRNGEVWYTNIGGPVASIGGHVFLLQEEPAMVIQFLMDLQSTGGFLYFPSWTYISDETEKTNVAALSENDALSVIKGLEPKTYTYKGENYTGFSAQNVQTYLPNAVATKAISDSFDQQGGRVSRNVLTIRDGDILATVVATLKNVLGRLDALEA